jgi:translation elongation factor EF-G
LVRRRGRPETQERRDDEFAVTATVPVNEMAGFAEDLHSLTQGRAAFTVRP